MVILCFKLFSGFVMVSEADEHSPIISFDLLNRNLCLKRNPPVGWTSPYKYTGTGWLVLG